MTKPTYGKARPLANSGATSTGVHLIVSPTGSRDRVLQSMMGGYRPDLGLGRLPVTSLRRACDNAMEKTTFHTWKMPCNPLLVTICERGCVSSMSRPAFPMLRTLVLHETSERETELESIGVAATKLVAHSSTFWHWTLNRRTTSLQRLEIRHCRATGCISKSPAMQLKTPILITVTKPLL